MKSALPTGQRCLLLLVILSCFLPLLGCGDGSDLGEVIKTLGFPATDIEIHRSMSSRSGWCRFAFPGPITAIASSGYVGQQLDTTLILGSKQALLELAAQGIATSPTKELFFQGSLSAAELVGLAPHVVPGVMIWEIAPGKEAFPLSNGTRIRISHLLWDPAAKMIYLLYSYMYG